MASVPHLPDGTSEPSLARQIGALLPLPRYDGSLFRGPQPALIELGPSFPLWSADIAERCYRNTRRWLHLLFEDGRPAYFAESECAIAQSQWADRALRVNSVRRAPAAREFDAALRRIAGRFDGRHVARAVTVPSHQMLAIWLRAEWADADNAEDALRDCQVFHPDDRDDNRTLVVSVPKGFEVLRKGREFAGDGLLLALAATPEPAGITSSTTHSSRRGSRSAT